MSAQPETRTKSDGIPLGSFFGVPIYLAYSWFVIAAAIVLLFGPDVQRAVPGIGYGAYAVALTYAILLALSVLIHELAHALSAKAFGWPEAKIVLTLWGGHTQFGSFYATPGKSLVVAMAGPVANFIIAGVGWLALQAVQPVGVTYLLWDILVLANFLVALFNVLPGLPLDGGRLVESLVWKVTGSQDKGTVAAGWAGRVIVALLIGILVIYPLTQSQPLNMQMIIVLVLVGGFMWVGASQSIRYAKMRLRLPDISARTLMEPATALPASATVAQIIERISMRGGRVVLVSPEGAPEAVVDEESLARVPEQLRDLSPGVSVARAFSPGAVVAAAASGRSLIDYLATITGAEYAVIDESGRIIGLLAQSRVVAAITGKY
ncbi:site-2 protease family protein [Paeniglutamicibacter cryotolerans]|uniref:Zinc metalloprotease n=1 Tax=Paeniglutamicibacter cryotolerans TaxID=670079 RepID=A0A839QLZ9_9MICC|nr:site-2 protease family protein [Paeniglutamicibacter cryotolerans]MBB2997259.1 Zn-dependent protease [Paeniglutamicibacter cryotolerans]